MLINSFFEEGPKLLDQLASGVNTDDADVVRRAAHSIKASARDFGATELATLSATLESMGRSSDLNGADTLVQQAQDEYAKVHQELDLVLKEDRL